MAILRQKIHGASEISVPESRCEVDELDADEFRGEIGSPSAEGGAPGCFLAKRASRKLAQR